jgi:hypothetical protein
MPAAIRRIAVPALTAAAMLTVALPASAQPTTSSATRSAAAPTPPGGGLLRGVIGAAKGLANLGEAL